MKYKYSLSAGIAAFSLLALGFWYTTVSGTVTAIEPRQNPTLRPIPTSAVTLLAGQTYRTFPGSVRATEEVEMAFSVDGLLVELNAVEGSRVEKGQVLARLDRRDMQNDYDAARARYDIAKKEFQRAQTLIDKNVLARADFDSAESAYNVAEAEMKVRKKALDDTVLAAPIDGVVSSRMVENYQHIKAKDTVFSIKDISAVDIVVEVPERFIATGGSRRFGTTMVSFDAAPGSWYDAKIKEFSIESDPVTRTYEVVVSLTPPENLEIYPGMTATVKAPLSETLTDGQDEGRRMVPLAAVGGDENGTSYVWVIPEQGGVPEKRAVEIGEIRKGGIEILSGLEPGQLVAVAGIHSLTADMRVRPANAERGGLDQ